MNFGDLFRNIFSTLGLAESDSSIDERTAAYGDARSRVINARDLTKLQILDRMRLLGDLGGAQRQALRGVEQEQGRQDAVNRDLERRLSRGLFGALSFGRPSLRAKGQP